MRTTALVLLLVCSCQWRVNCRVCNDIAAYRYLNDFVHNDKCESVDLVFRYLRDMTEEWGNGYCRTETINNLANHFGRHAHTPDHCQCNGTFQLQVYSTSPTDGIHDDLANFCLQYDNGYKEVYNEFFPSQSPHQDLVCRTHHSLWTQLRKIVANNGYCQRDIVYHLSYAFTQHGDPCTCSEKLDATTSSSGNNGDHCQQYDSYNELVSLLHNGGCMSANTVWHLLDDLQVKDSACRKNIQTQFTHSFTNISTDENNGCSCTAKNILTDNQHIHYMNNGSHDQCSQKSGSTYSDIERDLFTHITNRGCRNHNYLWPTLAGVKDYCEGNNCHMRHVDCTLDLIVRAAIDYPSQESDSCVCTRPDTTTTSTTMTTTTTTTTTTSTTPKTPTPTTTSTMTTTTTTTTSSTTPETSTPTTTARKPDAVTSTSQATIVTTEPAVSSQHTCNKYEAIEDIAKSIHVTHPNATPCDSNTDGSDDAYTIVACNMAPPGTWMKGINVMSACRTGLHSIPTYIPIATFSQDRTDFIPKGAQSGIFLGCDGNGIKMAVQKCNGVPTIIQVANGTFSNNPNNYYTIA